MTSFVRRLRNPNECAKVSCSHIHIASNMDTAMPLLSDLHQAFTSKETVSSLTYLTASALYETHKPYFITGDIPLSFPRTNLMYITQSQISFRDVREYKYQLSLNKHGFQYFDWSYPGAKLWNTESVNIFLDSILERLKAWLPDGPGEVFICYDYRV